jgi:alpha,alpha-trehalase
VSARAGTSDRHRTHSARASDPVTPHVLRDYALIADGERGGLVGPRGDLAWLCFPHWDSPPLFGGLIGARGTYSVTPHGRFVWGGYYEPATLIWRNRWVTDEGAVECCEALALPARPDRARILRRVEALRGPARLDVLLDPRTDFGETGVRSWRRGEDGCWRGRAGEVELLWQGAPDATPVADGHGGKALSLRLDLEEGEARDLVLSVAAGGEPSPEEPERAWAGVRAAWEERVPGFDQTAAPRDCAHAYALLSGMTGAGNGTVAAATMSLPERAQEGRSYDYRYVWIRDQAYIGQAIAASGSHPLLDTSVSFVAARLLADGPGLMPAYTARAEAVPPERHVGLPGYPGGADVAGNWVREQFQLDAFGEALLLFAAAGSRDRLDADSWRAAEIAAEAIAASWQKPGRDAGIWELDPDAWTHSRLICAAGLRALAQLRPAGERAADWLALADRIVAETAADALHPSGRWQRSPGDERIDAALLLPAIRGAIPMQDPRSRATLDAVRRELTEDGYCYRYKPDERALGEAEGAFLLCGFWLALALCRHGEKLAGARWFERNRAACGPPGLLSEEYDVAQRQLRGNLPQAFVHALLIETAVAVAAEEGGGALAPGLDDGDGKRSR